MKRRALQIAAVALICWGVGQMARGAYIHSKASLAQALILRAWAQTSKKGGPPKPWPWADTTPVARLGAPRHRVNLIVLDGGSGRTLAFGPGHVTGTARPGETGNVVIAGHRDTHFRFLRDLDRGDTLLMEGRDGELHDYEVVKTDIVDHTRADLLGDFGDDRLTLITCYPFDAIAPGGPLRYVVTAVRVPSSPKLLSHATVRPPKSAEPELRRAMGLA